MGEWAISVVGIVILTVLCDIILPDGKTNKYIKTVTAIIAICIMLNPIIGLVDSISFEYDDQLKEGELNNEYLEYIAVARVEHNTALFDSTMLAKGYNNVHISVQTDNDNLIEKIVVNISNLVISWQNSNIDIVVADITTTACNIFTVSSSKVVIDGKD